MGPVRSVRGPWLYLDKLQSSTTMSNKRYGIDMFIDVQTVAWIDDHISYYAYDKSFSVDFTYPNPPP